MANRFARDDPPPNEYADAINTDHIEKTIIDMESTLVAMQYGHRWSPYTEAALNTCGMSYLAKDSARRLSRQEARQSGKEAERKFKDELMRKYKPMLDEELWSATVSLSDTTVRGADREESRLQPGCTLTSV